MTKMNAKEKYDYAVQKLKNFNNYIEIGDFRKFILLVLNLEGSGPEALLNQFGLGGSKGKLVLPYDPEKKMYYAKVMSGVSLNDQLIIYFKSKELHKDLVNKANSKFFESVLTPYECKNLLPAKFLMVIPKIVDYTKSAFTKENSPKPTFAAVDSLFFTLKEFIVSQNLKYIFLLEGDGDAPDLAFTINMSFDPIHSSPNQIQYFDILVDEEKQLRGKTFVKMNEELEMNFLNEIKDSSAELFNSNFTIIIPIKSFDTI